jgi:GABA(A) receptor-associated protein
MEFFAKHDRLSPEQQLNESTRLRNKYPDRLPILVDRNRVSDPLLDKNKYLVPTNLTAAQLQNVIRKRFKENLQPEEAMFYFVNNTVVSGSQTVSQLFQEHARNGFLRVIYSKEATFGADQFSSTPFPGCKAACNSIDVCNKLTNSTSADDTKTCESACLNAYGQNKPILDYYLFWGSTTPQSVGMCEGIESTARVFATFSNGGTPISKCTNP